jgi:hypothetical protein
MHAELTNPEFLKEKARAKAQEATELAKQDNDERQKLEAKLAKLDVNIKRMADMVFDSDTPEQLIEVIKTKNIERAALRERLKHLGTASNVVGLDAANLGQFNRSVDVLHDRLLKDPDDAEARAAFHNVIESVVVHPTAKGADYEIGLYARVSAVAGGIELFPKKKTAQEIAQTEGLSRFGTGGTISSGRPSSRPSIGWSLR